MQGGVALVRDQRGANPGSVWSMQGTKMTRVACHIRNERHFTPQFGNLEWIDAGQYSTTCMVVILNLMT